MLQQTTVAAVIPYFERFLLRFPTVAALAAAEEGEVMAAWAGLGYYARARNLHACARQVALRGSFPGDVAGLRGLPGIGAYTSAAIAAIAFGVPVVPIDGNVERVVARLAAIRMQLPAGRIPIAAAASALGSGQAARDRPSDFAQALFDLGATVCTPANPACAVCPLMHDCRGRAEGIAGELPRKADKKPRPLRYGAHFWLTDADGQVLLRRRPSRGLLGGMTELPGTAWRPTPWPQAEAEAAAPGPSLLAARRAGAARLHPFRAADRRVCGNHVVDHGRGVPAPGHGPGAGGIAHRDAQMRQPGARRPAMNQRASLVFILVTLGFDALGFGIVVPIVPELVQALTGGDTGHAAQWVGALVATFAAAQFLAAPVLGGLSDRFGRRPVIILSLAGAAANYLLLAWAPSLLWLFAGRLCAGATAASASAANAYIADITPPALRSARFGLVGATFGAGFVFGPALGGVLGAIDLRLPFLVAAGLALANAGYGLLVLPESLPPERRRPFAWRQANPVGSLHALAADRATGWLALGWSLMWFGLGALQSSFVLSTGLRFGWGPRENGWALAAVGVSQALVQGLLVRPIIRRAGEHRTALAGFALAVLAYGCFGFAQAGWVIYLAIVLQAFGAISNPSMRGLLSARVGPDRQGALQGGLSSVEGLTAIVSPILASFVFAASVQWGGAGWAGAPFLLGALTYGAAALAVVRSHASLPSPADRVPEPGPV